MKIQWNKVTWYSILSAIIIFVGVYFLGFYIGRVYEAQHELYTRAGYMMRRYQGMPMWNNQTGTTSPVTSQILNSVDFLCGNNKTIHADFMTDSVSLKLSDGRTMTLPHALSADGARYANSDESFVFWTRGQGAFITEQGHDTYQNCTVVSDQTKG